MTDQERRGEVGEVAHCGELPIDAVANEGDLRNRLTGQRIDPSGPVVIGREQTGGPICKCRGDDRITSAARICSP
jgi:hypothetical protein